MEVKWLLLQAVTYWLLVVVMTISPYPLATVNVMSQWPHPLGLHVPLNLTLSLTMWTIMRKDSINYDVNSNSSGISIDD